jgi:hypothetical protein
MSGPDALTPRQQSAIQALLTSKTITAAAGKAKVAESTLRRWLTSDATFQKAYRAARRAVMDTVITRVQSVAGKAVDALERNLAKGGRPSDQIRAASCLLEYATRGLEVGDLLERVEELERLVTAERQDETPQAPRPARRPSAGGGD